MHFLCIPINVFDRLCYNNSHGANHYPDAGSGSYSVVRCQVVEVALMLTGQAKTDYQREYMRKRRSNTSVRPVLDPVVRPVKPKIAELQALIHTIEDRKPVQPTVKPAVSVPWYNPEIHTTGDTVRMKSGNNFQVVTL